MSSSNQIFFSSESLATHDDIRPIIFRAICRYLAKCFNWDNILGLLLVNWLMYSYVQRRLHKNKEGGHHYKNVCFCAWTVHKLFWLFMALNSDQRSDVGYAQRQVQSK